MFLSFLYPFLHFLQPGILFPEIAFVRPMQVIALLVFVVSILRHSDLERRLAFAHPAFKWMVAFLVVQMISVYRGGTTVMAGEAGYWLAHLQFVVVSLLVVTDTHALRRYVWGMLCGSMFVVAFGIHAVLVGSAAAIGGRAGAYGMYENHNDYSFLVVQILPFLYLFLRQETGLIGRWFLRVSLVACVAGVFLSLSRGGMLALMLEVSLIVVLTMPRRQRLVLLPIVLILGAGAIAYQWDKRAANQGASYTADDAKNSRIELWRAAANMVIDRPLLGVGSRTFGEHSQKYGEISSDNRGKNSHNTYIEVVATSGLLGLLAFYKMLRWLVRDIRRSRERSAEWWVDATRLATAISLYSIAFRAIFDAKAHDWSFYTLLVLGVASTLLLPKQQPGKQDTGAAPTPWGSLERAPPRPIARERPSA